MNLKLLIDGIVRQTTVLIAQISTASGSRSPLAHVTDEVFLSLARELEAQGVRKQVVADMFGLAMRSYQKRMQKLTESVSQRDKTLWEGVLEFIGEHHPSRQRVLERFSYDGEREVIAVLNDLVRSGLVYSTGPEESAVFGLTTEDARRAVQRINDNEALESWAWYLVFRGEAASRAELQTVLRCDPEILEEVMQELLASGRLTDREGKLTASNLVLPLDAESGWETAVIDHYRAVAVAIAKKVRAGVERRRDETTGGSTFTFTLTPDHPFEERVSSLLSRVRSDVQSLWLEVTAYNAEHAEDPERNRKVTFYCGQSVDVDEPSPHQ
jgi:hypothetical protein